MKRLLLFVCLVGAAVYLLTPPRTPPEGAIEVISAAQTEADREVRRSLSSSWGSSLQSLRKEPEVAWANPQQPASSEPTGFVPRPDREKQAAQPTRGAKPSLRVDQASAPTIADTEREAVEWVRLTAAVRARSGASVSSPGLWSYPTGSKAQVVGRANGWVQLLDPTTQERGWVYHAYLAPIDAAQTEAASKPPPVKVVSPTSPKPTRTAKPAVRTSDAVKVRKAERRRGRGLFKRRKARRAWSIGPAR